MTTITIPRALLEQALEALDNSVGVVYEEYAEAVRRYANMPKRKAKLDGLAAMAKAHLDTSDALRAELAKPVEHENCGHCGRRVIDAPWPVRKTAVAPAWHDAPTCDGLWVCNYGMLEVAHVHQADVDNFDPVYNAGGRWCGPLPQDSMEGEKS